MAVAVCQKCGEFKSGAFAACETCGVRPVSDDEQALALMLSGHTHDEKSLQGLAAEIKGGKPVKLPPETRDFWLREIRHLHKNSRNTPKKPWWKIW